VRGGNIRTRGAQRGRATAAARGPAAERLNRRFLVDREHGGVIRRIHVQADHIRGFGFEVGIVGLHVAFKPMGLQPRALPRFGDEVVVNLQHATQLPRAPMRAAVRRVTIAKTRPD
jgi:hypothetical protein